jgi:hypothetical protein
MTDTEYPNRFQPLAIGNIIVRNLIMQSAHAMPPCDVPNGCWVPRIGSIDERRGAVFKLYAGEQLSKGQRVGDCVTPRQTDDAVFPGFLAGGEVFENWTL